MSKRFRRQAGRDASGVTAPGIAAQQRTYEYTLPGDEHQVMVDAIALGSLVATRDFCPALPVTREMIEAQARAGCEQMKVRTPYAVLTNDFDAFSAQTIRYFTDSYLEQHARYTLNTAMRQARLRSGRRM